MNTDKTTFPSPVDAERPRGALGRLGLACALGSLAIILLTILAEPG
jgi:hypothetical protein